MMMTQFFNKVFIAQLREAQKISEIILAANQAERRKRLPHEAIGESEDNPLKTMQLIDSRPKIPNRQSQSRDYQPQWGTGSTQYKTSLDRPAS